MDFDVDFTPTADERLASGKGRAVTYRYQVSADITDEGGETRSASRSIRLGFVAVEGAADNRLVHDGGSLLAIGRGDWRSPNTRRAAKRVFRTSLESLLGPKPLQSRRLLRREVSDGASDSASHGASDVT